MNQPSAIFEDKDRLDFCVANHQEYKAHRLNVLDQQITYLRERLAQEIEAGRLVNWYEEAEQMEILPYQVGDKRVKRKGKGFRVLITTSISPLPEVKGINK